MRAMEEMRRDGARRTFALMGQGRWGARGLRVALLCCLVAGCWPEAGGQPNSDGNGDNISARSMTADVPAGGSLPGRFSEMNCVPTKQKILNGHQLSDPLMLNGHGQLLIVNRGERDAVVKVVPVDTDHSARTVYVTAGSEAQIESLDAGAYRLMFTGGMGWSENERKFCVNPSYLEFGQPLRFEELQRGDQIVYEVQNVTLHSGSRAGTVAVTRISEREFLSVP
jgi:hypothetical protein